MAGFKDLDFNERRAAAQKAKEGALAQFKARPPIDEAEQARRLAKQEAREAKLAEKRRKFQEAKLQAIEDAKAEQARIEAEAIAAAEAAAAAVELTEEERKAARDAKYAARKAKKGKGKR